MFASQLDSTRGYTVSQIPGYSYVYYIGTDLNGDRISQRNELHDVRRHVRLQPGRSAQRQPGPGRQLRGAEDARDPLRSRARADAELRPERELHLAQVHGLQLDAVRGRDRRRLHGRRATSSGSTDPIGAYNVPFYAVNPAAVPSDFARIHETRPGYSTEVLGPRSSRRPSACPIAGWRASAGPRTTTASTSTADAAQGRPDADGRRPTPEQGRRHRHHAVDEQRQDGHLPRAAEVPVHHDGGLRDEVEPPARHELPDAAGLLDAVLPELGGRLERRPVGPQDRAAGRRRRRVPPADRALVRQPRQLRASGSTGRTSTWIGTSSICSTPRRSCSGCSTSTRASFNQVREIMNPRIMRLGARITF